MNESVLVFCTQHMPTGGIESHLREFCHRMGEAGLDIDLVILNAAMLPETEAFYKSVCRKVYFAKNGRSIKRIAWLLCTGLFLSAKKYNAVYTNGQGESIYLFSRFISRSGPWVHHHHTSGNNADQLTWGPQYKKVLFGADTVIACSKKNAALMETALSRTINTIPCFSRDISGSMVDNHSKLRLGYYGRLIPEKGIDLLCTLSNDADLSPKAEIHIWGEGEQYPPSFFSKFPNISFHGPFFSERELTKIVAKLDAYLLLSTHPEGLPIALLEVMSAGLPWLATDMGGIIDIACDPLSTRVIKAYSSYKEIKREILTLMDDITAKKLNRNIQKELYIQKFSYWVLVNRWKETLALTIN
jgi:glycosyltransferase involved in cell wall biosynthesis